MITKRIWGKEYKLIIKYDDWDISPRDINDNLWIMLYSHKRYDLWDEELYNYWNSFKEDFAIYINKEFNIIYVDDYCYITEKEVDKIYKWIDKNIVYLPLYLYDHSWITMNTTWFTCWFDSWQVWYIYAHVKDILKFFQWNKLTKKIKEFTLNHLKYEVELFDKYITWEYIYFLIEERNITIQDWIEYYTEWDHFDSCWLLENKKDILEHSDIFTLEEIESCDITY